MAQQRKAPSAPRNNQSRPSKAETYPDGNEGLDSIQAPFKDLVKYAAWIYRVVPIQTITESEIRAVAAKIRVHLEAVDMAVAMKWANDQDKPKWDRPKIAPIQVAPSELERLAGYKSGADLARTMAEARVCDCGQVRSKAEVPRTWYGRKKCRTCGQPWSGMDIMWARFVD